MLIELTITDITRMSPGFICVAGIDSNGRTIRPQYHTHRITDDWCCIDGINIRPFTRVVLDLESPHPIPPHTEDWYIVDEPLIVLGDLTIQEKRVFLEEHCARYVAQIFGAPVENSDDEKAVFIRSSNGNRSLGTIHPRRVFALKNRCYENRWDYRLSFIDNKNESYRMKIVDLSMQTFMDYLRICRGMTCDQVEEFLNYEIFSRNEVYLRIGLARNWGKHPERCYLQVTGVYTFPDCLENRSFQEMRTEINSVEGHHNIRDNQGFYGEEPDDEDIPF